MNQNRHLLDSGERGRKQEREGKGKRVGILLSSLYLLAHATESISAWALLYSSNLFARAVLRSIIAGSSSNNFPSCFPCKQISRNIRREGSFATKSITHPKDQTMHFLDGKTWSPSSINKESWFKKLPRLVWTGQ